MAEPGKIYVGLDIGGTKLAAGLVDTSGRVYCQLKTPTLTEQGGPAVLERGLGLVAQVIEEGRKQGLGDLVGIGLAAAGRIDVNKGTVVGSTGLIPGWTGLRLTAAFEEKFGLPCRADNDVNAVALAEQQFGAGQGYNDALFVAAGTGLGGGLIVGGKLQQGQRFCAGEVGHTIIRFDGWPCECGSQGCLEQYTATAAIKRFFLQKETTYPTNQPLTIEYLAKLAANETESAASWAFEEAGRMLGLGLASLCRICDPAVIIVGGGLISASLRYFEQAQTSFQKHAWTAQKEIPVVTAQLGGQAGIIGAAVLLFA